MKQALWSIVIFLSGVLSGAEFEASSVKVAGEGNSPDFRTARQYLISHLELVSGVKVAGNGNGYTFLLRESGNENAGTWETTDRETVFTGKGPSLRYAVYDFLEKQLGIRWIAPYDTAFRKQNPIRLENGKNEFKTRFAEHYYWPGVPKENKEWSRHMKCDKFIAWNTRHAFVDWWERYGKTHPEIFAMNSHGIRGGLSTGADSADPAAAKNRKNELLQICYTAPGIVDLIIADHLNGPDKKNNVNVSSNDGIGNFCLCPACRKLDVTRPGIPEWEVLTDRYVWLVNAVARRANKLNPPLDVHALAYNETEAPPLREKLEPNILLTFVPTDFRIERVKEELDGWTKAGAKKIRIRPNLPCYFNSSLPLGFEKHGWLLFKTALSYPNAVGCNIDNLCAASWGPFGFAYYVMGRTILEPEKPFEFWEKEYLSAFGNAAPFVGKYYEHWRKNWETRILPDYGNILQRARYFNIGRGVTMEAGKYFTEKDFDTTDAFLTDALKEKLSPAERKRIEEIELLNRHARLVFRAVTLKGAERTRAIRELLKFRKEHKNFSGIDFDAMTATEIRWGDLTGMKMAEATAQYELPILETPVFWYFKIDPKEFGEKEKWFENTYAQYSKWGEMVPTHTFWQGTKRMPNMSDGLKEKLVKYDGLGWYAQRLTVPADWKDRHVFLLFGAVDESCKVWVNGELIYTRKYKNPGDEAKPFEVEITKAVNKTKDGRIDVVVQVEDRGGEGGIWKRVFLVSKKNS